MEAALSVARVYSLKIEENVGYKSYYTWKAKEKLIELLVKCERVKEALLVARDYFANLEEKVGYEKYETWIAKKNAIDVLLKHNQEEQALSDSRLLFENVKAPTHQHAIRVKGQKEVQHSSPEAKVQMSLVIAP